MWPISHDLSQRTYTGTGKTICIGDRMRTDREAAELCGRPIVQLFVTRSPRLCSFMKLYQQQSHQAQSLAADSLTADYLSLADFIGRIEVAYYRFKGTGRGRVYARSNQVTYMRFRREIYPFINKRSECKLDASVVWTRIRSFILGSIEAAYPRGESLSEERYLTVPRSRCKLAPLEQGQVYEVYKRYEEYTASLGLWDEVSVLVYF